jgi:hypothetical protein
MNAYLAALKAAALAGFYIPEIEIYYCRYSDFKHPHAVAMDFGY